MLKLEDFGVKREETILSNGSRIILFKRLKSPVSIRTVFLSGSRFDQIGKEGTSHFLEHMIIAGTNRFPSKDKLAAYIEQYGGIFRASTSADTINVNVSIGYPKDLKYACEVLHEIFFEPLFDENTIKTERSSILKELGNMKSNPGNMLWDVWQKLFFQSTEVGRSIFGSEASINSISKKDLIEFRNNQLVSGKSLFMISGDIELQKLKESFENILMLPHSKPFSFIKNLPIIREQLIYIKPYEKIDQVYMIFGFRTPRILYSEEPVLDIIAEILGGGRASILKKKLRYEKGLVYDVSAKLINMGDCGSWIIKTATSKNKVQEVIDIIIYEIKRVMNGELSNQEIAFAKNKITKSKLIEMQTSDSWIDFHAHREFFSKGVIWTLEDYLKGIKSVTTENIKEVANKYFGHDKWFFGACGDIREDSINILW